MFSTLRQGASIYILDKGENPQLKIGQIESVSAPQPRVAYYTQANDYTVDIRVRVDNETLDFQKVPTGLSSAPIGNIVLCDNRDDAISAVDAFMQNSQQILNNLDYHKKVVQACDDMLVKLNPAYAKDKERDGAIEELKGEIGEIRNEFRGAVSEIKSLFQMYAPSLSAGSAKK